MAEKASDPYSVLLKSNKLPMTLIRDGSDTPGLKQHQAKMTIETSSFQQTFGPKAQRKRVKLGVSSLENLAEDTENSMNTYKERLEQARLLSGSGEDTREGGENGADVSDALSLAIEPVFNKGQSRRIWNELYKV
jgi:nuclear GTP-binding protein